MCRNVKTDSDVWKKDCGLTVYATQHIVFWRACCHRLLSTVYTAMSLSYGKNRIFYYIHLPSMGFQTRVSDP